MGLIHPATLADVAAYAVPALGLFARRGGRTNRRGIGDQNAIANGPINFLSFFPGAYQVIQSDLGITYGGTMLASGTTPPSLTLTGTLSGQPVPIRITVGTPGAFGAWTGQISYDGGVSVAQVFGSAATVPLAGAGTGLTLNIAAGAAAADNVWLATCAGIADQSGNALHYSQASAGKQPRLTVGLNGNPGLLFDGVDDILFAPSLPSVAPGTTKMSMFAVWRHITWATNDVPYTHNAGLNGMSSTGSTPQVVYFNGSVAPANSGAVLNSWVETEGELQFSASDRLKIGLVTTTGNMGNNSMAIPAIGGFNVTRFSNSEFLALVYAPGTPNWSAIRAAVAQKYGGSVVV